MKKCLPPSAPQAKRMSLPSGSVPFGKAVQPVSAPKVGLSCADRNLSGVSPLAEQFEPTPAQPITQHRRMGGVS